MDFPIRGWNRSRPPASQSELLKDQVRAIPLRGGRPRFVTEQVPEKAPGTCSSPPRTGGDRLPAGQALASKARRFKEQIEPALSTRAERGGRASARGQGAWRLRWCLLYTEPMSAQPAPSLRIRSVSKKRKHFASRGQAGGPRCAIKTALRTKASSFAPRG
jgi:hypothetical protein